MFVLGEQGRNLYTPRFPMSPFPSVQEHHLCPATNARPASEPPVLQAVNVCMYVMSCLNAPCPPPGKAIEVSPAL